METIEKIYDVKKLKAEIKVAANYQKFLKTQRKTVKLQGERKVEPHEATYKHRNNRRMLASMYVAYGVMRGKDLDEMAKSHISKDDPYMFNVGKNNAEEILSMYKKEEVATT